MGAFGRRLGHEDGALMSGTSVLKKETPGNTLAPSVGHSEKTAVFVLFFFLIYLKKSFLFS